MTTQELIIGKKAKSVAPITRMTRELCTKLASIQDDSDQESLVQQAWLDAIQHNWKKVTIHRYNSCDAYVKFDGSAMLIEFKRDRDFTSAIERAKVLAQSIQYYFQILDNKKVSRTPDVIFVADKNECFALHVNFCNQFYEKVDFTLAPSEQWKNTKLVSAIAEDKGVQDNAIVYHLNDPDFSAEKIFSSIENMAKGITRVVPITPTTLRKGFDFFITKVLKPTKDMTANELVGRYYAFIKAQDEAFIANGKLMGIDGYAPVAVDETLARQFKARFGAITNNDHKELERLYDTLLADGERRRFGSFFTPKIFVDESHRRIARVAGEDWEQNCLVWDNCCGTKSLTRDYEFGLLFLSTLDPNELKCSSALSTEAAKTFVFDFLNGATATLPNELKEALHANRNKKIVFFLNPPYAGTGNGSNKGKDNKKNLSKTAVQSRMKADGLGKPANELTVQFLYRILELVQDFKLKDVVVGLFSNPAWFTGDACEPFRKEWLKTFNFENSFGFHSEEFAGVKPGWAINFSVWSMQNVKKNILQTEFPVDLIENNDGQELTYIGQHVYYNLDGKETLGIWSRGVLPKCKKALNTTDGINISIPGKDHTDGTICANSLGYFVTHGNIIKDNAQYVTLTSLPHSHGHGFNILPENFDRVASAFAARKLVENQWYNTRDCYMVPNVNAPEYAEWQKDCYIFSMFHPASNQTSIKGEVDGEAYEFTNSFFPFTKKETYELLGYEWKQNSKDDSCYIRSSGKLDSLTEEGQKVLDDFKACLTASAKARPEYHKAHPELQVNRWSAGWRQLKGLFEEACPTEFNQLKEDFKALKAKMLPMVYSLGFLRQ